MSKRRSLERERNSLGEIGEILGSMKTLAYMETRKLARFLQAEERMIESIEQAAEDFLSFEPELARTPASGTPVILIVGTERGFCGDFNRVLVERLEARRAEMPEEDARIIVVGHKLHGMLESDAQVAAFLDGASVAEDVGRTVQALIRELDMLRADRQGLRLTALYFDTSDSVAAERLLPAFAAEPPAPRFAHPPLLNVPPAQFLLDLADHFLLAKLNHMLNASLMAENSRRVTHLDKAVRHLTDRSLELSRKAQSLRQEEIIEEIEVILLSATALGQDA